MSSSSIDLIPEGTVTIREVAFGLPGQINFLISMEPSDDFTDLDVTLTLGGRPPDIMLTSLVMAMDLIGSVEVNGTVVADAWGDR